jgi:hypothetical protein
VKPRGVGRHNPVPGGKPIGPNSTNGSTANRGRRDDDHWGRQDVGTAESTRAECRGARAKTARLVWYRSSSR